MNLFICDMRTNVRYIQPNQSAVASLLFNTRPNLDLILYVFFYQKPLLRFQSELCFFYFLMNILFFKEPQRLSLNSGFLRTIMGELMGSSKSRSSLTIGTDSSYSARRLPLLGTLFKRGKLGSCQSIASHKSSKLLPPIFGAKKKAASSGNNFF